MNHAKRSLNAVTIIGCICREPELEYTPSGHAVLATSLATTSVFKSGEEKKEKTVLIPVVIWGVSAEYIAKKARKGSRILVTGTIDARSYSDRDGNAQTAVEVVAEHIQIMSNYDDQKADNHETVNKENQC